MTISYERYDEGRGVNYWELDPTLRAEVERTFPGGDLERARTILSSFGATVGETMADNSDVVDEHWPTLRTYDKHGELRNEVEYHPAHLENERFAYEAGIVADAFEAPPGRDEPMPLTHHFAMEYLLSYADVGLTCPVAMTAGVALVIERFDDGGLDSFYDGLTARTVDDLLQGAMFLTEKQGGSDVGATETSAEPAEDGTWRLTGEKWFCSNLDAGAILTLARREDAPDGIRGLSLFLVPRERADGERNDYRFRRLKDKLGTVSVPTGEVEFRDTEAYLVGDAENGFRYMSEMLNMERLSNAFASVGLVGRALLESKIHAANREVFGAPIDRYPLMRRDLVDMAVDHEAATAFTFDAGAAFHEYVRNDDGDAFRRMRMLAPIAKSRTGRLAVETASYAMEVLGGNGYVSEFVTHRLFRDAQVLPIWEGTSNVLALDVLRAMAREDAHEPVLSSIRERLRDVERDELDGLVETVQNERADLEAALATLAREDDEYAQLHAKELSEYVYDVYTAALLLAEADAELRDGNGRKVLVAHRFIDTRFAAKRARGIGGGDRFSVEHFDAVVRFADVAPERLPSLSVDR